MAALARCGLAEEGQIFLRNGVLAADRRATSGAKDHYLANSVMLGNEKELLLPFDLLRGYLKLPLIGDRLNMQLFDVN